MNILTATLDLLSRRFQAHFEPRQRGHIANLFLDPVRRGMTKKATRQLMTKLLTKRKEKNQ